MERGRNELRLTQPDLKRAPVQVILYWGGEEETTDSRGRISQPISHVRNERSPTSHSAAIGEASQNPLYYSYYRDAMRKLDVNLGALNVSKNPYGRYGYAPPAIPMPLREVREVDVDRRHKKQGKPTPEQAEASDEERRKRGQRVYDTATALTLWRLIAHPHPTLTLGPYFPTFGFDEDASELAKRGRAIVQKAMDASPATAQDQCRPYARMGRKIGESGSPSNRYTDRSSTR